MSEIESEFDDLNDRISRLEDKLYRIQGVIGRHVRVDPSRPGHKTAQIWDEIHEALSN